MWDVQFSSSVFKSYPTSNSTVRAEQQKLNCSHDTLIAEMKYVGYSETKYRLLISLAHPRDCHFAHVQ